MVLAAFSIGLARGGEELYCAGFGWGVVGGGGGIGWEEGLFY